MANTFVTPTWVTKDVATNYKTNLKFLGKFDRQWDKSFQTKPEGAQIGNTVQARIQQRFTVSEGQGLSPQSILNQTVPITINHQYHVDMGWSSSQATLEVEEVQDRYTKPAGRALAAKWDSQAGIETYYQIAQAVGTPGSTITANRTWGQAVAILQNGGVPDEFMACITPDQQTEITNANFALFQPKNDYFRSGKFADAALGVDEWYWDPLLPQHTTGSFTTATPIVSGGGQTGSSLAASGLGTYALKRGDRFQIDGVFALNPESYTSTGSLRWFVLTADVSGTTTGTLSIYPSIVTSGPLQNVSAGPAASAAISFLGATGTVSATMTATASKQNFVFHSSAFAFVMADLKAPLPGAISKRISSAISQLSIRYAEQWNIQTDQLPTRLDTIGGVAVVLPDFAVAAVN